MRAACVLSHSDRSDFALESLKKVQADDLTEKKITGIWHTFPIVDRHEDTAKEVFGFSRCF